MSEPGRWPRCRCSAGWFRWLQKSKSYICPSGWGVGLPDAFSQITGLRSGTIPEACERAQNATISRRVAVQTRTLTAVGVDELEPGGQLGALADRPLGVELGGDVRAADDMRLDTVAAQVFF